MDFAFALRYRLLAIIGGTDTFELLEGEIAFAALVILALMPWALGIVVVGPWLGHASWHAYRAALAQPQES